MRKENLTNFFKGAIASVSKRSPEILTGLGIAGMVTTTVLAVKSTPKALILIEEEKRRQNREIEKYKSQGFETGDYIEKLKPLEVIKVSWKCYVPSIAICGVSIACLVGASSVNFKRNAALATAYKISETAFSEYRDNVVGAIGEKKERDIKDKISEDRVKNDPVNKSEVIVTGGGETLCYDTLSGRYFNSSIDRLKKAENQINSVLIHDMYASLNDFYEYVGLSYTKNGESIGWNMDDGLLDLYFSSQLSEEDNPRPCIVVNYSRPPKYDFSKFL